MKFFNDFYDSPENLPRKKEVRTKAPENSVAIYTMLTILSRMRAELGLEAMLDYMDSYRVAIEESNPKFKSAVCEAIGLVSMERLYRKAVKKGK